MIRMHGSITTQNPSPPTPASVEAPWHERFLLWQVYVGSLNARHRREHQKLVKSRSWQEDLQALQQHLGALGLVL